MWRNGELIEWSPQVARVVGRRDAARRKLPMAPEELLEAGVLVYLAGLGFPGAKGAATR